jgi:hypothetical protein
MNATSLLRFTLSDLDEANRVVAELRLRLDLVAQLLVTIAPGQIGDERKPVLATAIELARGPK